MLHETPPPLPMTLAEARSFAVEHGFSHVQTFGGPVPVGDWLRWDGRPERPNFEPSYRVVFGIDAKGPHFADAPRQDAYPCQLLRARWPLVAGDLVGGEAE